MLASWLSAIALESTELQDLSEYEVSVYMWEWTSAG